jgi:hypothetical protein
MPDARPTSWFASCGRPGVNPQSSSISPVNQGPPTAPHCPPRARRRARAELRGRDAGVTHPSARPSMAAARPSMAAARPSMAAARPGSATPSAHEPAWCPTEAREDSRGSVGGGESVGAGARCRASPPPTAPAERHAPSMSLSLSAGCRSVPRHSASVALRRFAGVSERSAPVRVPHDGARSTPRAVSGRAPTSGRRATSARSLRARSKRR